jgi:hypothetical protein
MDTNTNGFNYSSDYQGHGGTHIIIIVLIFLCLLVFGSSVKKDVPNNNFDNDIKDTDYPVDNSNNQVDEKIDNGSVNDDENRSSGKMFEYYGG